MDKLSNAEQGRILMSQSTALLDSVLTKYSEAVDNCLDFSGKIGKVAVTSGEMRVLVARELERRAKLKFDAAKHESIVNVGGMRPMTEAEYNELKKMDTK